MSTTLEQRLPIEIAGDFARTAPVDLDAMARALGIEVASDHALPDDISGKIERVAGRFRITINGNHAAPRQRFTLAHELAHYLLHRDLIGDGITDNVRYRSNLRDDVETQANGFAAELLMPAALVRAEWRGGLKHIAGIAQRFDVSYEAAKIRLTSLGFGA